MTDTTGEILSPPLAGAAPKKLEIKPILQVTSGNALEIYDFFIYGYYAVHISHAYFPSNSEFVSLMMSLLTFALGFLARPVGALIIGSYTDRHGRRAGLILSLSLMSVGIIALACTPSFATIGLAAPIIVMLGRLLQGFSAGAELGGVVVYLAETSPRGKRAFYTCWQVGSQQFAVMAAAIIGVVIFSVLSPAQMADWGWRVPLLVGCGVIPVMIWLRSSLAETSVFARKKRTPSMGEICHGLVVDWRVILTCMGMSAMAVVATMITTVYGPVLMKSLKLGDAFTYLVVFVCGLTILVTIPLMAKLADRINRRTMLLVVTGTTVVTAYPMMAWFAADPTIFKCFVFEMWFCFLYASYSAPQVATMVELVPAHARTAGYSFAQAVAAAILGGFTPAIAAWLTHTFNNNAMVGAWFAAVAAISFVAALTLDQKGVGERQHADLH